MLHNISIACPLITTFVANCYMEPARLFVAWNHEIKSKEGTTQGDPTAMGAYALGVTPLIHFLSEFICINEHSIKKVAFEDDFTVKQARLKHTGIYYNNKIYCNIKCLCLATSPNHPNHI